MLLSTESGNSWVAELWTTVIEEEVEGVVVGVTKPSKFLAREVKNWEYNGTDQISYLCMIHKAS